MSSAGELFVNEVVIDEVREEITEKVGKDWEADISRYIDITREDQLPDEGEIDVTKDGKVVATISFTVDFSIVTDHMGGRWIEAELDKVWVDYPESQQKLEVK
jgi:hypothetical protein